MRIVLDECVPRRLRREFPGHDVVTVAEMGWSGKRNGELMALLAASGYEVLLTVDRNLCVQQNLANSAVAIVVMIAVSNARDDLLPLVPKVLTALTQIQPGQCVEVRATG